MSFLDRFKPKPATPEQPMLKPNPDEKIQRTPEELALIDAYLRRHNA